MKNKLMFFKNNRFHLIAFLISSFILLLIFIAAEIWPFGSRTLLAMDLWGQYYPMLSNISSAIWKDGLLWSWKGGLGFNYIAQSAYYSNSPLFFVFALIPKGFGIYLINYLILFKFGLASLSFSILLKFKYDKNDYTTAAFSTAYALCAYTVAFISQTMWFDAVILLPVIIIGLEKMLTGYKPYIYCTALFLTVFSNFFIAYAVCIFLFLYFIVFQISFTEKRNVLFRQTISFAGYSALSVGVAAFVIIPVISAVGKTLASTLKYEGTLRFYHSGFDFISRMIPGTTASLEFDAPNIYCSLLALICASVFLLNTAIRIRRRIAFSVLVLFMLLSFNLNILNYIWHGFHYPNQLPGRQSYMFCFIILMMAYESFINIKRVNRKRIIVCALTIFGLLLTVLLSNYAIPAQRVLIAELLIIINTALIIIIQSNKKIKLASAFLCTLLIIEVAANSAYMTKKMPFSSNLTDYDARLKNLTAFADEYDCENNEFYRIETIPNFTFNPGQVGGYNGITYYSSTMQGSGYNFFKSLGLPVYAKNVSTIYKQTPVTNMLFGVKYIYDTEIKNNSFGLEKIMRNDNKTIYKNTFSLPIAFVCNDEVLNFDINRFSEPLLVQNDLIQSAAGIKEDILTQVDFQSEETENAVITAQNDSTKSFYKITQDQDAVFSYSYIADSNTDLFFESEFKNGIISIAINGEIVYTNDFRYGDINYVGRVFKGDDISIRITNNKSSGLCDFDLYSFDAGVFNSVYKNLDKSKMAINSITNRRIEGEINVKEGGILFTSIPNDGGWSLRIDGKKTEVLTVGGYLCAYKIEPGNHSLEFSYFPDGLKVGLSMSALSVFLLVILFYTKRRKSGHKKQNDI